MLARVLAVSVCCACASFFPAPVPMRALHYDMSGEKARCLVLFLPGAGDSAEDFEKHGFIEEMRRRPLSVDIVAANATMGYYFKGILVERLENDIMASQLARGYEQVWAMGMSMGGFGSLLYGLEKPGRLNGIVALAPYLGDKSLIREIRAAGGVAKWPAPPEAKPDRDNYQRQLWRWLQAITDDSSKGPDLYLGWGVDDAKLGDADSLLATAMPPSHIATAPGGHDWPPWRALLSRFLDDSDFARACARVPAQPAVPPAH